MFEEARLPLISDYYVEQNRKLHETKERYGTSGVKSAKYVVEVANTFNTSDILDYGCGKGTLGACLNIPIREYDPGIPGKDSPPEPAEFVVCTDVLEHVEPEFLEEVLDDLQRLARKVVLLVVSTVPARKNLPDGRNAHLIVESSDFWLPKLLSRWQLHEFADLGDTFKAVLLPRLER